MKGEVMNGLGRIGFGLALSFVVGVPVAACNSGSVTAEPTEQVEKLGTMELKLVTTTPSGVTYRLREAILMVQGPQDTLFFNSEEDPNATSWSAQVIVGEYSYFLQEGWRMERIEGEEVIDIPAQLVDGNSGFFYVSEGYTTPVPLRFRVGDDILSEGAFEVSIQVEETQTYCTDSSECAAGTVCCVGGFLGKCMDVGDSGACPLPDLTVSAEVAQRDMFISRGVFPEESCALQEGCVDGPGERRLLNFSTQTPNVGAMDVILGSPTEESGFEYAECHGHYHFEGYAEYKLLGVDGAVVATGHKQAFCLLDSAPVVPGSPGGVYHCGFQGISAGWSDIYGAGLDCQWVDITEVPVGDYLLQITINPEQIIEESNYDNNTVYVPVHIGEPDDEEECAGQTGPYRDCAWDPEPEFQGIACTPGEVLEASCGCECGGDTILRVCDGTEECSATAALGLSDDYCGLCSQLQFTCPESGVYSVFSGSYNAGLPYECPLTVGAPGSSPTPPVVDAGVETAVKGDSPTQAP